MRYSIRFVSLVLWSLALMTPKSVRADRTVSTDTTQDGGTFVVDPAGSLTISDPTNDPLLILTNGANTSGTKSLLIGRYDNDEGSLLVENKSMLSTDAAIIGYARDSTGSVTITGPESLWTNGDSLFLGFYGQGTLNIENGGKVTTSKSDLGYIHFANGTFASGKVTVNGSGSRWDIANKLNIGNSGEGTLSIDNGGIVTCASSDVGSGSGTGSVTVTGAGSQWIVNDRLEFNSDSGMFRIENGGTVTSARGYISVRDNIVTVADPGSKWENSGTIFVGSGLSGGLSIENGGLLTSGEAFVGLYSVGNITVSGAASKWRNSGNIYLGGSLSLGTESAFGLAKLVVQDSAMVDVGGSLSVAVRSTLTVQNGGVVKGNGTITVEAVEYSGIAYMGTLTGDGGTIQGDVINHGIIAPGNSPGVLTIDGDLTSNGVVQFELAGIGTGLIDQLIVTGELNLGGVVELDLLGGFHPTAGNSFKLLNFGSLIDSGFTFDLSRAILATNLSWDTSTFTTDGTIRVVPEASSLMLAGMAAFAGLFVWRKNGR